MVCFGHLKDSKLLAKKAWSSRQTGLFLPRISRLMVSKVEIIRTSGPSAQVRCPCIIVCHWARNQHPRRFFFYFASYIHCFEAKQWQASRFLKHTSCLKFGKQLFLLITKKMILVLFAPLLVQSQVEIGKASGGRSSWLCRSSLQCLHRPPSTVRLLQATLLFHSNLSVFMIWRKLDFADPGSQTVVGEFAFNFRLALGLVPSCITELCHVHIVICCFVCIFLWWHSAFSHLWCTVAM